MKNTEMVGFDGKYETTKEEYNRRVATKRKPNQFKANVSKKMRKEWGEQMAHLRSIK